MRSVNRFPSVGAGVDTGDGAKALSFFEAAWEASRNRDPPDIVMTGPSADCAALEFEAGHIERSLELMQRALTESADNVPFKAPYSAADAFPGP